MNAQQPSSPRARWIAVGIAALTLAVYLPCLGGQFLWDDLDYIGGNLTLRTLDGLRQIWNQPSASPQYYPLVFTSFWLEYHLWGTHPVGYRAINLLLHLASAGLIWLIMNDLRLPGGWLAAAIFALHPVHVESVAWISERKNVLSAVFYLLAMRVYLRPWTRRRWAIALLLFVAALLSKSVTATWPAAVLVILWWREGSVTVQDLLRLLPFFVLAVCSGWLTAHLEQTHVGAVATRYAELNFSFADRLLIAGRAVGFYLGKLFVPWPLSFIYPRWQLNVHAWWQWIWPLATALGVIALLALLAKKSTDDPRSSPTRGYSAAMLLFIGTLSPALGFINLFPMRYSFVADHFQYLATPMLIVPVASLLVRRFGFGAAVVLLPLAVLTALRTPVFSGPLPLWSDTWAKNSQSWMVCTQLANALNGDKQHEAAGEFFLKAYALAPQLYETQTNAAIVLARRGQTERALALLRSSAKLNPDFPITYFNWGQVLENNGDPAGAIRQYRRAVELAPDFPAARQRLNSLELQQTPPSLQSGGHPPGK